MIGWSWGAFLVYVVALVFVTLGGFMGLVASGHPAFLAPILMGLLYFWICYEIVAEENDPLPPASRDRT